MAIQNSYVPQCSLQQDGKIIAIGSFTINGTNRKIIRLNNDGSLNNSFENVQPSNAVNCVSLQSDNKILLGGLLANINGISKNNLARLNTDGFLDMAFNLNTGLNDKVLTVALQTDNKTLLGGHFTTFNGFSQNKIMRILDDGSKDESFSIGSGFNNTVNKIVVQPNNKLLIGGALLSSMVLMQIQ
ncbi:delta-60 repeat domain-containing protein [Flavobacterium piscinae]|nr:delta-60 repeat domain-containing protein [Flavobacterium piscinae]